MYSPSLYVRTELLRMVKTDFMPVRGLIWLSASRYSIGIHVLVPWMSVTNLSNRG